MTKQEAAIVMAYTGVTMLTGEDFIIFHAYIEKLLARSVWTHEIPMLSDDIKERSKSDFISLCRTLENEVKQ